MEPTLDQRVPCARGPWRRDADPMYWHPREFLRMTENIRQGGVMLCHKSPPIRPIPDEDRSALSGTLPRPALCAGFVLVDKLQSIGLRFWALRANMNPVEACSADGVELHESWDSVLRSLPIRRS